MKWVFRTFYGATDVVNFLNELGVHPDYIHICLLPENNVWMVFYVEEEEK